MKSKVYILGLIISFTLSSNSIAQINKKDLLGAWTSEFQDENGNPYIGIGIITDGYFSVAKFNVEEKKFISTLGGSWVLEGNTMHETLEFNTADPESVGTTISSDVKVDNKTLTFLGINETWTKLDDGSPGGLPGAWIITGRERNGQMTSRRPGPRKTMKILSGTRFQWIAYNVETKQFMGTGGGTYTTENGKYIENIDFFSRNSSRVGASLDFNYEIKEGDWHHQGMSSKGDPIYEIWSLRKN